MFRKLHEAWLSAVIEWRYSKEQILEAYLNEIYLGQTGGIAVRGVGAAARVHLARIAEYRLKTFIRAYPAGPAGSRGC